MPSLEVLAALATIGGLVVSVLALVQSGEWQAIAGAIVIVVSVVVGLYARKGRSTLKSASVVIEGHSIDSLNIANLRRRVNRTFTVQEAHHKVRIVGEDLEVEWRYSGFCRKDNISSIEFSIDADEGTTFTQLECAAFDLGIDPEMAHKIRPVLIGNEGISKKIGVTFLEPLNANQPFSVFLSCKLPRSMRVGFDYYTSTSSFAQSKVPRCVVHLIFEGAAPEWMRVYEINAKQPVKLVKTLPASVQEPGRSDYIDVVTGRHGQSARVYAFWRDAI